ncbi:hypothetical protein PoB_006102200 [Plakobranchus ocellatus]|uniref:PH domain-containing protein n=1 Tax=Plakobranchus ocellatus TaxID=259542 RepID=A0AAV4CRK7_9GAST|nr:hypothetical protein PoB_006102200 [Plakobranchus ocellatus]
MQNKICHEYPLKNLNGAVEDLIPLADDDEEQLTTTDMTNWYFKCQSPANYQSWFHAMIVMTVSVPSQLSIMVPCYDCDDSVSPQQTINLGSML